MQNFINDIVVALQNGLGNSYLIVFIVSMIPMIETRGAIPIAVSLGMDFGTAYLFSVISGFVVCPILYFCFRPILTLLKKSKPFKKLASAIEENFSDKAQGIKQKADAHAGEKQDKARAFYKALGLFVFVALPLPLTGVWTGSVVAAFLDLDWKYSLASLLAGNFVAGGIITLMTYFLGENSYIIIYVLAAFIVISVVVTFVTLFVKRRKRGKTASDEDNNGVDNNVK